MASWVCWCVSQLVWAEYLGAASGKGLAQELRARSGAGTPRASPLVRSVTCRGRPSGDVAGLSVVCWCADLNAEAAWDLSCATWTSARELAEIWNHFQCVRSVIQTCIGRG